MPPSLPCRPLRGDACCLYPPPGYGYLPCSASLSWFRWPAGARTSATSARSDAVIAELEVVMLGGERPARLVVPGSYEEAKPLPLVVLLHGATATSAWQDGYFGLSPRVEVDEFFLLLPEGARDGASTIGWNVTAAQTPSGRGDDVSYLVALIGEAEKRFAIDADRIWAVGHSNGAFMAYRLACEGARVTAIVSLAGSENTLDTELCDSAPPIHVLQIHGDQDGVVSYSGRASLGAGLGGFLGAEELVLRWAERGGCDPPSRARRAPRSGSSRLWRRNGCAAVRHRLCGGIVGRVVDDQRRQPRPAAQRDVRRAGDRLLKSR